MDKFDHILGQKQSLLKQGWTNLVTFFSRGNCFLDRGGQIWLHFWIMVITSWIGVDKFGCIPWIKAIDTWTNLIALFK